MRKFAIGNLTKAAPVTEPLLESIELATPGSIELAVIWLHGLGADGHDFEPIVPELGLELGARFVFPHAPVRPVTINNGMRMRAWYDIFGFGAGSREDEAGIRASAAAVKRLVDREVERGVPASRIVIAGFSQGGAVALQVGLRAPQRFAGVLALST
jgi:phospholipase/carboxylesterase